MSYSFYGSFLKVKVSIQRQAQGNLQSTGSTCGSEEDSRSEVLSWYLPQDSSSWYPQSIFEEWDSSYCSRDRLLLVSCRRRRIKIQKDSILTLLHSSCKSSSWSRICLHSKSPRIHTRWQLPRCNPVWLSWKCALHCIFCWTQQRWRLHKTNPKWPTS